MAVVMALFKGLLKEEYISKFIYVVLSRAQFLMYCRTEGLSTWLAGVCVCVCVCVLFFFFFGEDIDEISRTGGSL